MESPADAGLPHILALRLAMKPCKMAKVDDFETEMKRFSGVLGIDQGSRILFNDFAHDGAMWTGSGAREVRLHQRFAGEFLGSPVVTVSISMWDIDHLANSRVDISAENVTTTGFDIVFRTWGDTHIARIRADWTALGSLQDDDTWDVV